MTSFGNIGKVRGKWKCSEKGKSRELAIEIVTLKAYTSRKERSRNLGRARTE